MKNRMNKFFLALVAVSALFLITGCSAVGIRTGEEARYKVLVQEGAIQIREYEPYVIAETLVNNKDYDEAGSLGFRRLFAYISGKNQGDREISMTAPVIAQRQNAPVGVEIEMTAPVVAERTASGWVYAFVLPAGFPDLESAPLPADPLVKLKLIPGKKMAAITYAGSTGEKKMNLKTRELTKWIQGRQLTKVSDPVSARYDPPWTLPFFRRNEVLIEVN